MLKRVPPAISIFAIFMLLVGNIELTQAQAPPATRPATRAAKTQPELEAEFAATWTNAVLEGSFTSTGAGQNPARLSTDRYTLGSVRKLGGKTWVINARIGQRDNSPMIPIPLPIEWAGDTPVIIVDNITIPGMGTYSARVMFFDAHYSGYWKHGERGGILFGVVRRPPTTTPSQPAAGD